MVINGAKLKNFYQEVIALENIPYRKALAIYEMLHKEAVSLGAIGDKNMLDGIDIDIRIAKVINALKDSK